MKFPRTDTILMFVIITLMLGMTATEANAMDRPAVAWRLFQQENPCPATGKKTGPCPGWIMQYKKPLEKGGDIAPYNLFWVRTKTEITAINCK